MTPTREQKRKLPRVGPPAVRATVTFEPVVPLDGPATPVPLVHVRRPAKVVTVSMEPVPADHHSLELELPVAGPEGDAVRSVETLVGSLSQLDVALGGAGLTPASNRSAATTGRRTLVLEPLAPDGAATRLKAIESFVNSVFAFAGTPVRARVKEKQPAAA